MKKKTHSKQQLLNNLIFAGGRSALLSLCISVCAITACTTVTFNPSKPVSFNNPPSVGTWLTAQRELVACETEDAARYMADYGFFHAKCTQLHTIGRQEYRVLSRSMRQIDEGPMWLLQVKRKNENYYVPIPWHDWL